ncbi:hypothetical protein SMICM304S_05036 [Streptomyces microflavus]
MAEDEKTPAREVITEYAQSHFRYFRTTEGTVYAQRIGHPVARPIRSQGTTGSHRQELMVDLFNDGVSIFNGTSLKEALDLIEALALSQDVQPTHIRVAPGSTGRRGWTWAATTGSPSASTPTAGTSWCRTRVRCAGGAPSSPANSRCRPGRPLRGRITRPDEGALKAEVQRLEKQRDQGTAQQPGKLWTVEKWLWHWVENIAKDVVSENTYDGYEVAVRVHLVPGHPQNATVDRLEPEHLESLYRRMQKNGSKAATAHQAHRTARTAFGEAVRRGHAAKNAAALAKPPRVEEPEEIEPYSVEGVQSLLIEVNKRRNSARWMLALALGLRQGETLGLRWVDVDLDHEYLKLRRNRLRPKYKHKYKGAAPCGRKAGYCPDRKQVRRETKKRPSRAPAVVRCPCRALWS